MALHSWKTPRSLEKRGDLCAWAVQTWWGYTGSQEPALGAGGPNWNLIYLLALLVGLRLTHFLLRSFFLPCQLFEFKPSLCPSSAFRVYTIWFLPWLKGINANAAQHDQIINVFCPEQSHSIPFTLRTWSWARSPIDCGRLFKRFLSRFRTYDINTKNIQNTHPSLMSSTHLC